MTELLATVTGSADRLLARGAGRSYGDAAVNPDGATVLMERLDRILGFDDRTGVVRCEAGVSMQDLVETFLPRGWFPMVTPGTKFVTVGGSVAGDVHGKNHHRVGSFGSCVRSLEILVASGEVVRCSLENNRELFRAAIGGLGLVGIILEAELQLRPVQTAYVAAQTFKAADLDRAISLFEQLDPTYEYSVAWVNGMAKGKQLGESLVSFGNHAAVDELNGQARRHPLSPPSKNRLRVPLDVPSWGLNRYSMGAFNALYFGVSRPTNGQSRVPYDTFLYPLDRVQDWNRLYGKKGFVQYQCAVPHEAARVTLRRLLERCQQHKLPSALGVLKRFGGGGMGGLSFPIPGYTLSLDFPVRAAVFRVLEGLDELVIEAGGRVNLGKDARLSATMFRRMYPDRAAWLGVKSKIDPSDRFTSALARRLELSQA